MPIFRVEAPDGTKFQLEGDSAPTEAELEEVFRGITRQRITADVEARTAAAEPSDTMSKVSGAYAGGMIRAVTDPVAGAESLMDAGGSALGTLMRLSPGGQTIRGVAEAMRMSGAEDAATMAEGVARDTKGSETAAEVAGAIGSGVGSAPSAMVPGVGLVSSAVAAGLGSYESTRREALKLFIASGLDPEEAETSAHRVALKAGVITGGVTGAFNRWGPGAGLGRGVERGLSTGELRAMTLEELKRSSLRPIVREILRESGGEGAEEAVDQALQEAFVETELDPQKSLLDAVKDIAKAGGLGAVAGAAVGGPGAAAQVIGERQQAIRGISRGIPPKLRADDVQTGPIRGIPEAVERSGQETPPDAPDAASDAPSGQAGPAPGLLIEFTTADGKAGKLEGAAGDSVDAATAYLERIQPGARIERIEITPERETISPAPPAEKGGGLDEEGNQEGRTPEGVLTPAPIEAQGAEVAAAAPASAGAQATITGRDGETAPEMPAERDERPAPAEPPLPATPAPRRNYGMEAIRSLTEGRPPDLLDWLEDFKIRTKARASKGTLSYYDNGYDSARAGVGRKAFSETGLEADVVAQSAYNRGMIDEPTIDALWEGMRAARVGRSAWRASRFAENRAANRAGEDAERFARAAIDGKRAKNLPNRQVHPVMVDDLMPGDAFEIAGEKVVVEAFEFDADDQMTAIRLKDGRKFGTQTVAAGTMLQVDDGTLQIRQESRQTPTEDPGIGDTDAPFSTREDAGGPGLGRPRAQALLDRLGIRSPRVVLVDGRERHSSGGIVEGALAPDGRILLYPDNLRDEADLRRVLRHEALHDVFGDQNVAEAWNRLRATYDQAERRRQVEAEGYTSHQDEEGALDEVEARADRRAPLFRRFVTSIVGALYRRGQQDLAGAVFGLDRLADVDAQALIGYAMRLDERAGKAASGDRFSLGNSQTQRQVADHESTPALYDGRQIEFDLGGNPFQQELEFRAVPRRVEAGRGSDRGSGAEVPGVISVVAAQFARELKFGVANPVGKRIRKGHPEDLHAIANLFRNPRFEVFRWVFLKRGKVARVVNFSARLASSVVPWDEGNLGLNLAGIDALAREIGADSFFVTHNHPSANSTPSEADIRVTRAVFNPFSNRLNTEAPHMAKLVKDRRFLGHIVTNHQRHTVIDGAGGTTPVEVSKASADPMLLDLGDREYVTSESGAELVKQMFPDGKDRGVSLILLTTRFTVRAVLHADPTTYNSLPGELRAAAKDFGARFVYAHSWDDAGDATLDVLARERLLVDAFTREHPGGRRSIGLMPAGWDLEANPVYNTESQVVNAGDTMRFSIAPESNANAKPGGEVDLTKIEDREFYHGTRSPRFDRFDSNEASRRSKTGLSPEFVALSSNREVAKTYARGRYGHVRQFKVRPGTKVLTVEAGPASTWNQVDLSVEWLRRNLKHTGLAEKILGKNWHLNQRPGAGTTATTNELALLAKDSGFDGVLIPGIGDESAPEGHDYPKRNLKGDTLIVFDQGTLEDSEQAPKYSLALDPEEKQRQASAGRALTAAQSEVARVAVETRERIGWNQPFSRFAAAMVERLGEDVRPWLSKAWEHATDARLSIQNNLSPEAQAAWNQIEGHAEVAPQVGEKKPLPVYDPEKVARWWNPFVRPSDVVRYFGGDDLLRKRQLLDMRTAYQSAAVKAQADTLREQLEESFWGAKARAIPRFLRPFFPKAKLRKFMRFALPIAARLNVTGGAPGAWTFAAFDQRAGFMPEAEANRQGIRTGDKIWRANTLDGSMETLTLGAKMELENGTKGFQILRRMDEKTQAEVYQRAVDVFPEFQWFLDTWLNPGLKDTRVTVNGVEIPVFNRFALAGRYAQGDPKFASREAYTPDVTMGTGLIGAIRQFRKERRVTFKEGTVSPGRKYETGSAREMGNTLDLLSGFNVRAMQVLQEDVRKEWMRDVLASASDVPREGLPESWVPIENAMADVWRAVQTLRKFDDPLNFPQTTERMRDDDSPAYKQFFGEILRLRNSDAPKMVPKPLVDALVQQFAATKELGLIGHIARIWARNWKAFLLLMPDTFVENRTDNYLRFLIQAHRQLVLSALRGGDRLAFREARKLAWAGISNMVPGMRPFLGLNDNALFKRMADDVLPPELFEGGTRLQDLWIEKGTTDEEIASNLEMGQRGRAAAVALRDLGPLVLEKTGYGKMDVAAKRQFVFTTLLARAEHEAQRQGLKGDAAEKFIEGWMMAPPEDAKRRAIEGANRLLLNYGDTPGWLARIARLPVINTFVAFPLFRYHFLGREIDRATSAFRAAHRAFVRGKKLTREEWAASLADLISYATLPAMGYGAAAVAGALADSLIGGDGGDDDDDPREIVGASSVFVTDENGETKRKPLPRELVTANRLNVSALLRSAGVPLEGEKDYWWHIKDYPIVRSAALFYLAANDARRQGFGSGIATLMGGLRDMLTSLAGAGQAIKVPAKIAAEIQGEESGRPAFTSVDPFATAVPLDAYITLQALNLIPGQRQANEVMKWLDPVPRRVTRSKELGYDPGVTEALQAEGWTGLADRVGRGITSGEFSSPLPPQGRINRRLGFVEEPREFDLESRIAAALGQNIKPIPRTEYEEALRK